jgi:hypothetical protein
MMAKFMRIFKLMPRFIGVRMAQKSSPTYPDVEINRWIDSKDGVSFDLLNSMQSKEIGSVAPLNENFGAVG